MTTVCVGCGLTVVGGKLTLDLQALSGFTERSATISLDATALNVLCPNPSTGTDNNIGVASTELNTLVIPNDTCRDVTFMINAHGRARVDVRQDIAIAAFSNNNEVRNEIRVNGGTWRITDLASYATEGTANGRQSREWNSALVVPPVVVAAGASLTIDRRAVFRYENNMITHQAFWNMPGISAIGI